MKRLAWRRVVPLVLFLQNQQCSHILSSAAFLISSTSNKQQRRHPINTHSNNNNNAAIMTLPSRSSTTHMSCDRTAYLSLQRPFTVPFLSSFRPGESGDTTDDKAVGDSFVPSPQRPESSLMPGYITDFLLKQRQAEEAALSQQQSFNSEEADKQSRTAATYLIAIPMEDSHDLLLELESVQRAILYHCPVLVHSCLVPAQIRLPLLYVHTSSSSSSSSSSSKTTTTTVTTTTATRDLQRLTRLVREIVQQEIFDKPTHNIGSEKESSNDMIDNNDNILASLYRDVNADGVRPVVMTFQSLNTSGRNHQALYTVGSIVDENEKHRLSQLVSKLQTAIESMGWTTSLSSLYEQQLEDPSIPGDDSTTTTTSFQARVPFMRLPTNFEDLLAANNNQDPLWRTSDQGGNGISPIFWCQWWDDVFAKDVRLRHIGIYPQEQSAKATQQQQQLPEEEFHIPYELIPLPCGNAALALKERQEKAQQQERLLQQYQMLQDSKKTSGNEIDSARAIEKDGNVNQQQLHDELFAKTQARLESLYDNPQESPLDTMPSQTESIVQPPVSTNVKDSAAFLSTPTTFSSTSRPSSDLTIDDWTRERIRNVIESRTRNKPRYKDQATMSKRKDLPPIEENSVFLKYRDGSLVNEESPYYSSQVQQQQQQSKRPVLPPFPSREHFIGIWRAVTPPTGFPEESNEATRSDNLILRVDGTTAGGPILDYEQQQKAAGGTWRILEDSQEKGDNVRLRIRLVIPPKKERILVMEGDVTRICMTPSDLPLTSSTFGIPELENRWEKSKEDHDDMLHCGGDVWIEDAVTGDDRNQVGSFTLMKIASPSGDPSQFTVTIPRPVRYQD